MCIMPVTITSLEFTTLPLAYSYIRFSRLEQRRGDSIRRQTAMRDEYVARKKLQLDTSFVLSDQGLSAFRGRNKRTGALKLFLDAVDKYKIKKGSHLIIESLDRLSREQVEEAFDLFMSIIRSGIVLVTLVPEMEYTKGNLGLSQMILALAEFTRAHGESLIKSQRSKSHWGEQRRKGKDGRLTYVTPGWIEWQEERFVLIPERAKIVRDIFAMCIKGFGAQVIVRRLNQKGVPCFGRGKSKGKRWHKSYIAIMLRNRACIGEHQPHVIDNEGQRVPFGQPIPDYYPPVVTPETFAKAQQAVRGRNSVKGGINHHVSNLFARLVKDEAGNAYTLQNRNTRPYLVSSAMMEGVCGQMPSIPYEPFERCVLEWIRELELDQRPDDPLPGLKAREADLVARLDTFRQKIKTSKQLSTLLDVFAEMEQELEQVRQEIQEAMTPREHALTNTKLALDYLDGAKDSEEIRRELRHHLSLLLDRIIVRIDGKLRSRRKVYYLTLHFRAGAKRQIFFETPTYNSGPWDEDDDFPPDTMEIRSELNRRDKTAR